MNDDIIKHVCAEVSAIASDDYVRRLEISLRHLWGGAVVYIPKSRPLHKAERIRAGRAAGMTMIEACEAAGVSRSTGYRLVSRLRR